MTSPSPKSLFLDALDLPIEERLAFLDERCEGDPELRAQVDRLVDAHSRAGGVFGVDSGIPGLEAAVLPGAAFELELGDSVGPYILEDEIGAGGFGVVFRAAQAKPVRRKVALKIIKLGMDTKSVIARFELERQALALMDHPNIARVFDAGATEAGRPYFAMELVDGLSITEHCEREQLDVDQRVRLFAQAARAVHHAHQRGILHRDIKPSNVLVADVDGEPQLKVIDFGVAKATSGEITDSSLKTGAGFLLGTPNYMSPEQAEGALDIDTRADVYSLGVLLYELLSGMQPFNLEGLALPRVLEAIRDEEPPRPSTRRIRAMESGETSAAGVQKLLNVPPELDWIVMRCLEKERERRYSSANDLAADLERFLNNEPVEAAPPSRAYRVRKFVRRHRAATIAVAGIAAALLLGMLGTALGLVRAERANIRLDAALVDATDANEKLDAALQQMEVANLELDQSLKETEAARKGLGVALGEAQRQSAIAEAVNQFLLQDLLGAARPTGQVGRGPETPIRDLLDMAAAELDTESGREGRFANERIVEASLRFTIGVAYDTLGVFTEASKQVRRCVDLRTEELGAEHIDRLVALSYLGHLKWREREIRESVEYLTEAYELLREQVGPEDEDVLRAVARLANALRDFGRSDDALALLEETVPIAQRSQGKRGAVVTDLCAALAILYADRGRFEEAKKQFGFVIEAQTALLGPKSPVVLNTRMNMATLERALGRFGEAEQEYREILVVQSEVEGPDHPHTLTTRFNFAECLLALSRYEEAHEVAVTSIPAVERSYGRNNRRTLLWLALLGTVLERMGRVSDAEGVLRDAHLRGSGALGPTDPATLDAASNLANVLALREDGRDEARELLRGLYEVRARSTGPESLATLGAVVALGGFHAAGGELDEAREYLEPGHVNALRVAGEEHPLAIQAAANLAFVCAKQGDLVRAAALLRTAKELSGEERRQALVAWTRAAAELVERLQEAGDSEGADRWERALADRVAGTSTDPK